MTSVVQDLEWDDDIIVPSGKDAKSNDPIGEMSLVSTDEESAYFDGDYSDAEVEISLGQISVPDDDYRPHNPHATVVATPLGKSPPYQYRCSPV